MTIERQLIMAAAGRKNEWSPPKGQAGAVTKSVECLCSDPVTGNFLAIGTLVSGAIGTYAYRPFYVFSNDGGYTFTNTTFAVNAGRFDANTVGCDATGRYTMLGSNVDVNGQTTGLATLTSTNGTTWTGPTNFYTSAFVTMVSVDVDLATNRWVAVLLDSTAGFSNYVSRWTTSTNGTSWSSPSLFNGSNANFWVTGVSYNPTLGRWTAVGFQQSDFRPMFSTSLNGTTWTTPALMNPAVTATNSIKPGGTAAGGTPGVLVTCGPIGGIFISRSAWISSTNGTTWSTPPADFNGVTNDRSSISNITCSPVTNNFVGLGRDSTTGANQGVITEGDPTGQTWTSPTQFLVGSNFIPGGNKVTKFNKFGRLVTFGTLAGGTAAPYWTAINGL